jgi:hypothetical protein
MPRIRHRPLAHVAGTRLQRLQLLQLLQQLHGKHSCLPLQRRQIGRDQTSFSRCKQPRGRCSRNWAGREDASRRPHTSLRRCLEGH